MSINLCCGLLLSMVEVFTVLMILSMPSRVIFYCAVNFVDAIQKRITVPTILLIGSEPILTLSSVLFIGSEPILTLSSILFIGSELILTLSSVLFIGSEPILTLSSILFIGSELILTLSSILFIGSATVIYFVGGIFFDCGESAAQTQCHCSDLPVNISGWGTCFERKDLNNFAKHGILILDDLEGIEFI